MFRSMARAMAFVAEMRLFPPLNSLRASLVYGCAIALIVAGPFFPGIAN
jgi:hypothetical protein